MKILVGHNHYQWVGGEDAVFKTECNLLEKSGHQVYPFEADNSFLENSSLQRVLAVKNLFWSKRTYKLLQDALRVFKPDVAHFHNIYFSLTPSVYDACHDGGVPVVQSLHNYRMFCANALLFRNGKVCEDCIHKSPLEGIINRCYKNSTINSMAITAMTSYHRWKKTWFNKVDMYITATEFTRRKYIQFGIAEGKIAVKPNVFIPKGNFINSGGNFVLYVGRLSQEKGVEILLEAWEHLPHIPLKIAGDGPLGAQLKTWVNNRGLKHIEFLGSCDENKYQYYMQNAKFLVIPSGCYENFPRIAAEAFAFGLPVLASRLGSLVEIIKEGYTGLLFEAFNSKDLISKSQTLWNMDLTIMSQNSKKTFDELYSPSVNVNQLIDVYNRAIDSFGKKK